MDVMHSSPLHLCVCSLDAPLTGSSESDSFDLDALLGVSKKPLSSSAISAVASFAPAKDAQSNPVSLPTCDSAERKLTPPLDSKEPKLATETCENEDELEENFSNSSCTHSSKDRQCRSRHNTFVLSPENEEKGVELSSNLKTQVKCPVAVQDQPSIDSESNHPLVTPPDLPPCPVNSKTYSKASSLGLPVIASSDTKDEVPPPPPTSVTRLKMPSSLKKPSKARGTFNSSVCRMHLSVCLFEAK